MMKRFLKAICLVGKNYQSLQNRERNLNLALRSKPGNKVIQETQYNSFYRNRYN